MMTRTLFNNPLAVVLAALLSVAMQQPVSAQKTDFKDDVFPALWSLSLDGQKSRLNEYLLEDPVHPFSLFRTAMIYEVNYRQANPLTDYEYAMANARKAEMNYTRAQSLVKPDEVRSHDDYYARVYNLYDAKGKPQVPFAVIETRMRNGVDSARIFLATLPPIYKDFTRSIGAYERAVRSFTDINSRFATAEDMQMLYDEKLESELLSIKKNYDSAIIYLNSYLKRSEAYQPLGFRQKLTTRPVTTFRLDGFVTVLNFLVSNIRLWDYGTWVDQVVKLNTTEVADLRLKTQSALKSLDANLDLIEKSNPQSLPKPVKVDKQLFFNLTKYDKPSFAAGLLTYKSFLQDWRLAEKGRVLDTAASESNAAILTGLVYNSRRADTLLTELKSLVSPHNLAKHKTLVAASFSGESGVNGFVAAQQKDIHVRFTDYAGAIRRNLSVERRPEVYQNTTQSVKHGSQSISFDTVTPHEDQLKAGKWVALVNFRNADGSAYLLGEYYQDKAKTSKAAFAAHVNPDGHVNWVKSFNIHIDSGVVHDAHARPGPALLLQDGVVFLLRAQHLTRPDGKLWVVGLSSHGEERFRTLLPDARRPRQLLYSERSNGYVVAQRGSTDAEDASAEEPVLLTHLNALGEKDWDREFAWKGTLTGIFDFSDGYGLVGNYSELRDLGGKIHRTGSPGDFNPFLARLSASGELMVMRPVPAEKPVLIKRVVRLGDNGIHFIGQPLHGASAAHGSLPVHLMTNKNGTVICSSF